MPSVEVGAPVSSVASARLVLGVGWVRPGAGGIDGGALNPLLPTAGPMVVFALRVVKSK